MFRKAVAPGPVAAVFALAAASYMLAGGTNFCLDDAWIHLSYAKSLRLGDGLSYNPGDHATGFSSPLWVLLLAALPWGTDPVLLVKLLGAFCHAAAAWGCAKLAELVVRDPRTVQPSAAGVGGTGTSAGESALHVPANSNAAAELPSNSALNVNSAPVVANQNVAAAAEPQTWPPSPHSTAAPVAAHYATHAAPYSTAPATGAAAAAVVLEQSSPLAEAGSIAVRVKLGASGEAAAALRAVVAEPVALHPSTGSAGTAAGAERPAPVAETSSMAAITSDSASRLLPAFVAGTICAIDPGLTFSAVSGMEVSLTAALLVWGACAVLSGRPVLAAALAACAVWARPESLFFIGAWSVLRFAATRTRAQLLPLAAAIAALFVWMGYCALVSGYPFPNTYYAKREALVGRGLLLFVLEYLPAHGWVVCLTGLALLVVAVSRPGETRRLVLAWFVACIAIAATRKLIPNTQFYSWRYFAVFAVIPCVAMACALRVLLERRWLLVCALAPIALTSVWMLPSARALQRAQELDIRLVHTDPAKWLATVMPPDARLLVEGAGATRFFLPRTAQVIDAVGLNLASVVHTRGQARVCEALRLAPTHVLLPDDFFGLYRQVLQLQTMRTFVDPEYRIVRVPVVQRVWAAKALQVKPAARAVCAQL